jgi:hypothetical protein
MRGLAHVVAYPLPAPLTHNEVRSYKARTMLGMFPVTSFLLSGSQITVVVLGASRTSQSMPSLT